MMARGRRAGVGLNRENAGNARGEERGGGRGGRERGRAEELVGGDEGGG